MTNKTFNIENFLSDLKQTGLIFNDTLIYRLTASLLTKQFVLLTGLSGSGKTKIAEAFSAWITTKEAKEQLSIGTVIGGSRATYTIAGIDSLGLLITPKNEGDILLPFYLIEDWIQTIQKNNFAEDTPSQTIQKKVSEDYTVNTTLNSFHSPLKAVAFFCIKNEILEHARFGFQVCFVSVGADWTNREPLLGFANALESGKYIKPETGVLDLLINAERDPANPYFLILDEMNLSYVERYFADFLSAMESSDKNIKLHPKTKEWEGSDVPAEITLPKNLFIIGTVNIDETTYMFSPKVLDRANVVEFRISADEMTDFFDNSKQVNLDDIAGSGAGMGQDLVVKATEFAKDKGDLQSELMPFFYKLQEAGVEFGYRTASEVSTFVKKCSDLVHDTSSGTEKMTRDEIVDAAIMQKLLPKLHGSRNKIESIIKDIANLCLSDPDTNIFTDSMTETIKYPISYDKLQRMYKRVQADGFVSYAEA